MYYKSVLEGSLICTLLGIIPVENIAGITREDKFGQAQINSKSQVLFIDELVPDGFCTTTAKRILQGGLVNIAHKHKDPSREKLRIGAYITTNEVPDFGSDVDNAAVRTRLSIFQTRSLPRKDTGVSGKSTIFNETQFIVKSVHL